MAEYMLVRLMMAGGATGLLVLVIGMYKGLQVMLHAHHAKKTMTWCPRKEGV